MKPNRYRWTILALVWLASSGIFLTRLSIGPLAPFLKESLNISNTQVGLLVTAAVILYVPASIIGGWLADNIGPRRVLIFSTLFLSLCLLALFFASSYRTMFIILLLAGLSSGCILPSVVKSIITWFPQKERATALGLNQTAVNIGGIAGASILPTVALTLGWRYSFLFIGFTILAICLLCFILYRSPTEETLTAKLANLEESTPQKTGAQKRMELFKSRDIWMIGLAGFSLAVVEFSIMTYLVTYLKEQLLFSVVAAGGLLAMTEAGGAIGKPVSGILSDRIFKGQRKAVFFVMAGMTVIICIIMGIGDQQLGWLLYPILIILGTVAIGWGGLYFTLAGEIGGKEDAGIAAGTANAILIVGVIIGPPLFGKIVDTISFQMAWFTMAIFGAISIVFIKLIREHKRLI